MKSVLKQSRNGMIVTCLMSLYFKSEEDTMKNEIPAAICLAITLPEEMRRKQMNNDPNDNVVVSLD